MLFGVESVKSIQISCSNFNDIAIIIAYLSELYSDFIDSLQPAHPGGGEG